MVRFDYGVVLMESLKKTGGFLNAKTVAHMHNLSPSLMEKVAQEFRHAGWLESKRGAGGGYRLLKNVSLGEVIFFFDKRYKLCPISRLKI